MQSQLTVFVCALAIFVNNGFILVGLTAFDVFLLDELSVSVAALKARDGITLWTVGIVAPLGGYMADRWGVKPLFTFSLIVLALCMYLYSLVTDIVHVYAIHVMLGLAQVFGGWVVALLLVSRWTTTYRGLAIGTVLAGSSLGNALLSLINIELLTHVDWRTAFTIIALVPIVLIPAILFLLREQPETTFSSATSSENAIPPSHDGVTFRDAMRSPQLWMLGLIATVTTFSALGVATNAVLFGTTDLGLSFAAAGRLAFAFFVGSLFSQVGGGLLADRIGGERVLIASVALMGVGCFSFANTGPGSAIYVSFLFGLGWGGTIAMIQFVASVRFFGAALGRILAILVLLETTGGGLDPAVVGAFFDRFGNYSAGFLLAAGLCLVSLGTAVVMSLLRQKGPSRTNS